MNVFLQFLKKFLSYLLPDEESNISFLNWLSRLFLLMVVLSFFLTILFNTVKNTEFGKDYGLINTLSANVTESNFSLTQYTRVNREIWVRMKELRDKYDNFYFAYIINFYDKYADNFVSGLSNDEAQIYLWIEPKEGSIVDFSGLEEVVNRRAVQIRNEGFNEDGCNKFSIPENLYPFLRGTFTNFRLKEEVLEVIVCPIKKNTTEEVVSMSAMYYLKVGEYKQLEAAFRSITKSIEVSLQPYI